MHREMCRTNTDRDCRRGGRGRCRVCPYRKGGELYKTAAEKHEDLVRSWYHQVVSGASGIFVVPTVSCGRALQSVVRNRVERDYRLTCRHLADEQKQTIERMRRAAPNDAAAAADCSTNDVYLWLLPGRTMAEYYDLGLDLEPR